MGPENEARRYVCVQNLDFYSLAGSVVDIGIDIVVVHHMIQILSIISGWITHLQHCLGFRKYCFICRLITNN